tara:strand:+ start:29738 stop:29989 length:252 start_codon:yes stop_codon:yes gene_type:complete
MDKQFTDDLEKQEGNSNSVLAEQYVRARTERDRVVSAFNTLKTRQREIEEELAELRRAAKEVVEECYEEGNVTTAVITLNGLV